MSYAKPAYDAILDWAQSTGAMHVGGPFFARQFPEGMVVFEIKNWNEGIALSLIKTPPEYRGKGLASRALGELHKFADKHGVPITGSIDAQEDPEPAAIKPLNNAQLKKWYKRSGYAVSKYGDIRREPSVAAKVVESLLDEASPKQRMRELEAYLAKLDTMFIEDEDNGHHFPDGDPVGLCWGGANQVVRDMGGVRFGFPEREDVENQDTCGGHDFAVVDGRYIVDYWLEFVVGEKRGVFDMQDPRDAQFIKHYYGDPANWEKAPPPPKEDEGKSVLDTYREELAKRR